MSNSLEHLALRKRLLQAHSVLCRLRIRHELTAVQDIPGWARAGVMAATALPIRSALLGVALYGLPHGRLAKWLALAARMLLLAKAAGIAINLLQKPSAAPPTAR